MPHGQQKSRARNKSLLGSQSHLWVFSATILRPLTSARNYATIADPKKQIREVIFASIFRNNRARKRIRTPIFHQGSYAHRMAQRRGFEPPDESPPSHDFQSCSLNHSDISAGTTVILQQIRPKCNCFSCAFVTFPVQIQNLFRWQNLPFDFRNLSAGFNRFSAD